MAKPTKVDLNEKQKKIVLTKFKTTKNARSIAKDLEVSRYKVMAFLESKKLAKYSIGSYN